MPFVINETMGAYSELLMLLAAGTYTVAFIAFAWDLAKSSKVLRAVDFKAAEAAGTVAGTKVPVTRERTVWIRTWPGRPDGLNGRRRPLPSRPERAPPQGGPPTPTCATQENAGFRLGWLSP
jgi:hypothetical protein